MANVDPPFFYGGPVATVLAKKHLHGFEEEQRSIVQYLNRKAQVRLGVFGGPRSGKTSILLAVAGDIPSSRVHLDCAKLWPATKAGFFRLLASALDLPGANGLEQGTPAEAYASIAMPRRAAKGVFVLENAHTLLDVDRGLLDELPILAARIPHHIVLTGSPERLTGLVDAAIELRPFTEATANDFLRRRFSAAGLSVDADALGVLFEFTRGQPDLLQRIGLTAWRRAVAGNTRRVLLADAEAAVGELVDELPTDTIVAWAGVRGIMRDAFIAMCLYDLESPTEIAKRLDAEPKNVIVLLSRLASGHGLVERVARGRYRVKDPLLKHFVRKEFGSPLLR